MRVIKTNSLLMLIFIYFVSNISLCSSLADSVEASVDGISLAGFQEALDASDDRKSVSIGKSIFEQLEKKYRGNTAFGVLKSKFVAAEFLANQMQLQLRKAAARQLLTVADVVLAGNKAGSIGKPSTVAPAKQFYEGSAELFSRPVQIAELTDEEGMFLSKYYGLKLRILTSSLAKAGQALAIAEPTFEGTHNYVLVLPLLHTSQERSINIDVLPRWMCRSEQLNTFSDSCLLHYGFPFHAMMLAKQSAQVQQKSFSEQQFYQLAVRKCRKSHPHIAADCIRRSMAYVAEEDIDAKLALHFSLVQLWLDSGNYNLAAGEARKLSETFGKHEEVGKSIWLYYYSLSRNNSVDIILADIDEALADERCIAYKARLMYVKWWALRRKRNESARVAAVEYELLKQYGKDSVVAPILLSRATDCLASQDYSGATGFLNELLERFPSTKAAVQAKGMIAKLQKKY